MSSVPWPTDFIQDFMSLTEGAISPEIFRKWGAIALLAGACERRVWVKTGPRIAFPNLYTLLVAPPGVGKYIIEEVRALWTEAVEPNTKRKAFHVSPDNMTKASLIDCITEAKVARVTPQGAPIVYHSLLVPAEEFSVLLPDYDMEYIGTLNSIFNNKPLHSEARRHGPKREVSIENPQLNLLGGVQPAWMAKVFPEDAWNTGLARRMLMIYSAETPLVDIFAEVPHNETMRKQVLTKLGHISSLYGQCVWHPEASDFLGKWHLAGGPPIPTHTKLQHYVRSRTLHCLKLTVIACIARSGGLRIELTDVTRAIAWLVEIEKLMPDIFRAMVGKSDAVIIDELHYALTALFAKSQNKPINEELIFKFLSARVPSEKIEKIIMIAERANVICRVANTSGQTLYKPVPRTALSEVE